MLRRIIIAGILLASLGLANQTAADIKPLAGPWPQFRGPNRDGVSTETGLLKQWPKDGPKLLWQTKGAGRGYSSVAIAGGKLYTMGDDDKDESLVCFDDAGKQLWKTKLGAAWNSGQANWQSSRSTPTVDGDTVYILTPSGSLVSLDAGSGKERWRKSMQKDFSGKKGDGWGYSESVLIDGDWVVCTPGGAQATVVALAKQTGEPVWKASVPGDRGAGHASMSIAEVGGVRVYVQSTAGGGVGIRAKDGKVLWTYPIGQTTAVIPNPIVRGDLVFYVAGYNRGGALLRQVPAADGVKVEEVYGLNAKLNNKHGGVVLVGEFLYGDTNDGGIPYCAELMTGKIRWNSRGSGKGSAAITAADGHLYVRYASGHIALVKATPDEYKEISAFKIPQSGARPSWSHPVITGGKLYLREGDNIFCYDIKQK